MVTVKLYVEGGGDSDALRSRCREGFHSFLDKAGFSGHISRIVSCGGRGKAIDRFKSASDSAETCALLIDSEDFVTSKSPWTHLANRPGDGFMKPIKATDDHCYRMVICMESRFLADKDALVKYFGNDFGLSALF